ncbi:serine/threonine protein phosphatase, partial [Clostridioides difficile]
MNRTIMISDIHGYIDPFNQLLDDINYNSKYDQLILLGDYVDRGPNSKEVVKEVIRLVKENHAIALRGNHDQRFV